MIYIQLYSLSFVIKNKNLNCTQLLSMEESRLKIARKKKGLTQREAADLLGITASAWSSAERGASKMHRNNLELVAQNFDVSFSWLVTGEGSQSMSMPTELGDGKFVPILTTSEMLERKTKPAIPKYMFMPTLQHENALGYTTASDLPPEVSSSTLIVVPADLEGLFENGKWYLIAIDGLLIVRKVVKVIFGKEKGKFRLTDWNGEVDYLEVKNVKKKSVGVWRIIWRVEGLG